ncbi:hypothetical protein SLA2020_281650 [Shorea laevis]
MATASSCLSGLLPSLRMASGTLIRSQHRGRSSWCITRQEEERKPVGLGTGRPTQQDPIELRSSVEFSFYFLTHQKE